MVKTCAGQRERLLDRKSRREVTKGFKLGVWEKSAFLLWRNGRRVPPGASLLSSY